MAYYMYLIQVYLILENNTCRDVRNNPLLSVGVLTIMNDYKLFITELWHSENLTILFLFTEWFMLSIGLSCGPIFIMAAMACCVLIHTMFILNQKILFFFTQCVCNKVLSFLHIEAMFSINKTTFLSKLTTNQIALNFYMIEFKFVNF